MSSSVFPVSTSLAAQAADFLKQSDPTAYAVWRLANGSRSIQALAEAASISEPACWDALDRLFDQGALANRVAPPSATPHPALLNRREAMSKVMLGAMGATALMSAPQVFADTGISMETNTAEDSSTVDDADAAELKRPMEQRKKQASEHGSKIREKRQASESDNKTEKKQAVERHKKQIQKKLEEKKSDKAE